MYIRKLYFEFILIFRVIYFHLFCNIIKLVIYSPGYTYSEERVVRDGNLVTSRGPGTAFEFGIELVRAVRGDDGEADKLAGPMLIK